MDKKGKFASLLFTVLIVLPLLGLLMMDYQVRKANDITGAYLDSPTGNSPYATPYAAFLVLLAVVSVIFVLAAGKWVKSRRVSTPSLSKINDDIGKVDKMINERGDGDAP